MFDSSAESLIELQITFWTDRYQPAQWVHVHSGPLKACIKNCKNKRLKIISFVKIFKTRTCDCGCWQMTELSIFGLQLDGILNNKNVLRVKQSRSSSPSTNSGYTHVWSAELRGFYQTAYRWLCVYCLSRSLCCDDCIFMCKPRSNLPVDYITPLWFSNYCSDRPGNGNDLWELGSAFWLCWPAVNQFDFGCLSEKACIYT